MYNDCSKGRDSVNFQFLKELRLPSKALKQADSISSHCILNNSPGFSPAGTTYYTTLATFKGIALNQGLNRQGQKMKF